jgi:hypothetical protein
MRHAHSERRAAHEALEKAFRDGRPLETYRVSAARALAKASCAALIFGFVSLLGPVMFALGEPFGVEGESKGSGPPWVWLAVTPFMVGVFLYLRVPRYIFRKLQARKLTISVFPEGLVCRTRAGLVTLPWDEIAGFERDPTTVELGEERYGPWLRFIIRGRDGPQVALEGDDFAGVDRLVETIEARLGIRRAVPGP